MVEHEWVEEEEDISYLGTYQITRCKNCGGVFMKRYRDLRNKAKAKVKKIKIPSTNEYLTEDCEESLKIMQTYWEKAAKKKSLYSRSKTR